MKPLVYLLVSISSHQGPCGFSAEFVDGGWDWSLEKIAPVIRAFKPDGVIVSHPWGIHAAEMRLDAFDKLKIAARKNPALRKIANTGAFSTYCTNIFAELSTQRAAVDRVGVYVGGKLDLAGLTLAGYARKVDACFARFDPFTTYPLIDVLGAAQDPLAGLVARSAINRFGRVGYEPRPFKCAALDQGESRMVGYSTGEFWWTWLNQPQDFLVPLEDVKHEQIVQCEGAYGTKQKILSAIRASRSVAVNWYEATTHAATAEALKAEAFTAPEK